MGYKVNRVGTPAFVAAPSLVTADISGSIAGWEEPVNQTARKVVIPDLTVYRQFGFTKAFGSSGGAMTPQHQVCFGQLVAAPEVANGNAVLAEFQANFLGQLERSICVMHRVGLVIGAIPGTPWGQVDVAPLPTIIGEQNTINDSDVYSIRAFHNVERVMAFADQLDIKDAIVCHFLEFADTLVASTPVIGSLQMSFAYRGIHTAEVIRPFDPTR